MSEQPKFREDSLKWRLGRKTEQLNDMIKKDFDVTLPEGITKFKEFALILGAKEELEEIIARVEARVEELENNIRKRYSDQGETREDKIKIEELTRWLGGGG